MKSTKQNNPEVVLTSEESYYFEENPILRPLSFSFLKRKLTDFIL